MTEEEIVNAEQILEALQLWHEGETAVWPLAHLRLGLHIRSEQAHYGTLADTGPAAQNRAILSLALDKLRTIHSESEELLRQRFEHRQDILVITNSMNMSRSSFFYRQKHAVIQLTEILNELEKEARLDWQEQMISRLEPPTYTTLVGIEETYQLLANVLMAEGEPFILCLDGLGGLGKTALADYLARQAIATVRFDEIAWVTAKQTHLSTRGRLQIDSGRPALTFPMLIDELTTRFDLPQSFNGSQLHKQRLVRHHLQESPCLIIIDNLETVADYAALIPELKKWQNPSKFLITSRLRLLDQPGVFSYSLTELRETAVYQLIRQEAKRTGFADLERASDEELRQVYQIVGGNPLAIKLVIGQLRYHSLQRVLTRITASHNESGIGLFDYIYQEAWDSLDEPSQTTLIALTHAGDNGFTLEHLIEVAGISPASVERAVEELVILSLVDLRGSLFDRRYSLHRLTEMFLLQMMDQL
jgi:DNA-binding MarR family transcriptional regulator